MPVYMLNGQPVGVTSYQNPADPRYAAIRANPAPDVDVVDWLVAWGYPDVVALIRQVEATIRAKKVATRRSWWEVLAGTRKGNPRTVHGVAFPVLASARRRQGFPITAGAVQRHPDEAAPTIKATGRWHAGKVP